MEKKCPLCQNHCIKTSLQCGKGRQYFHCDSKVSQHEFMQANDLTSQLMKCGHILMHKTGKKRGQENILEILSQKDAISQKELQVLLGIEAGSLSEILSKLEQKGFIKRYKDQNDKRKLIISLTQKGQDKIKNKKTDDEDLFDMLNTEEKQQFIFLLDKVLVEWKKRHIQKSKSF